MRRLVYLFSAGVLQRLFFALTLLGLAAGRPLFAQGRPPARAPAPTPPPVSLVVKALSETDLPYPGQPVKLMAGLVNTRSTEGKMVLALTRDGRFSEIPFKPGYLNRDDRPVYEVEMPAPVAEISYQAILHNPDGSFISSQRYVLRRKCIPEVDMAPSQIDPAVQGSERLRQMMIQKDKLESDLKSYDQVIDLLQKITQKLKDLRSANDKPT